MLLWVDDLLCRGMPKDTEEFHSALGNRFECREEAKQILTEENSIEYVGIRLSVDNSGELPYFSMDQYSDTADLLLQFDLGTLKERTAPSPERDLLTSDSEMLGDKEAASVGARKC